MGYLRTRFQTSNVHLNVTNCQKQMNISENGRNLSAVLLQNTSIEAILKHFLIASWESFLESSSIVNRVTNPGLNNIFTFEPLYNLLSGISKLLKHCMIHFLSSNSLSSNARGPQKNQLMFSSVKTGMLCG